MSEANVEVVRRANAAINDGNFREFFELWHPAVEFRDLAHAPDAPEVVKGLRAVLQLSAEWTEVFDEFRAELSECADHGDHVVCVTRWIGTGRGSDLAIDTTQVDVYEVRGGQIVRATLAFPDKETALATLPARRG